MGGCALQHLAAPSCKRPLCMLGAPPFCSWEYEAHDRIVGLKSAL